MLFLAIAKTNRRFTRVNDEVTSYLHVFRTKADVVLVEVLVFVHGVVGVDILGIRRTFVGSGVTFSRFAGVG